jgi:hypothetical protein
VTENENENTVPAGTIDGLRPGGLAGADGDRWLRTLLGAALGSSEELDRARREGAVSEEYAEGLAGRFAAAAVTVEDVYVLCVLYGFSLSAVLPVAPLAGGAGRDDEEASL